MLLSLKSAGLCFSLDGQKLIFLDTKGGGGTHNCLLGGSFWSQRPITGPPSGREQPTLVLGYLWRTQQWLSSTQCFLPCSLLTTVVQLDSEFYNDTTVYSCRRCYSLLQGFQACAYGWVKTPFYVCSLSLSYSCCSTAKICPLGLRDMHGLAPAQANENELWTLITEAECFITISNWVMTLSLKSAEVSWGETEKRHFRAKKNPHQMIGKGDPRKYAYFLSEE